MYSDAEGTPSEESAETPEQESEEYGETTMIPKTLLGGKDFKPGEEVVFKIVRFHDNGQVEIAYATGKGSEEKESGSYGAEAEMPTGMKDSEMASMME